MAAIVKPYVFNLFNLVFFLAVNFNRWRRLGALARKGGKIGSYRLEDGRIEDRINLNTIRKLKLVYVRGDNLNYPIGS